MPAVAPGMIDLVAGEFEGPLHFLICHPPVAAVNILVVPPSCRKMRSGLGSYLRMSLG